MLREQREREEEEEEVRLLNRIARRDVKLRLAELKNELEEALTA